MFLKSTSDFYHINVIEKNDEGKLVLAIRDLRTNLSEPIKQLEMDCLFDAKSFCFVQRSTAPLGMDVVREIMKMDLEQFIKKSTKNTNDQRSQEDLRKIFEERIKKPLVIIVHQDVTEIDHLAAVARLVRRLGVINCKKFFHTDDVTEAVKVVALAEGGKQMKAKQPANGSWNNDEVMKLGFEIVKNDHQ
jgi:hypothetical protein